MISCQLVFGLIAAGLLGLVGTLSIAGALFFTMRPGRAILATARLPNLAP